MSSCARSSAVALFDLDGTITFSDTLMPFLGGYLARHPSRLIRLWRIAPAILRYAMGGRDRGRLKSQVIQIVMAREPRASIEAWARTFVESLEPKHRYRAAALAAIEAHRAAGDHLVLLSASPDLYVPDIGRALKFERTLCTELLWSGERLDGGLKTLNRRGEEKSRCLEWLRTQYPHASITAYGNSASDLAHMIRADHALLVNGTAAARRQARKVGIPVSEWR